MRLRLLSLSKHFFKFLLLCLLRTPSRIRPPEPYPTPHPCTRVRERQILIGELANHIETNLNQGLIARGTYGECSKATRVSKSSQVQCVVVWRARGKPCCRALGTYSILKLKLGEIEGMGRAASHAPSYSSKHTNISTCADSTRLFAITIHLRSNSSAHYVKHRL
jgi:hypothetical protein